MYTFISDPGHGWLEIPTADLIRFGVVDKITAYSYLSVNGLKSYLEEDQDAGLFMAAYRIQSGRDAKTREIYQEHTAIRDMPPYDPAWVKQNELALLALS